MKFKKISFLALLIVLLLIGLRKSKSENIIVKPSKENKNSKINYDKLLAEQLFLVEKNSKWGFIDKSGNIIIDINYDKEDINYYNNAFVEINNEIYNFKGEKIFNEEYIYMEPLLNDYIKINQIEKITILDMFGEIIEIIDTKNNLEYLKFLSDKKQEKSLQQSFSSGLARLENAQGYYWQGAKYVNVNQEIVIDYKDCIYSGDFREGLAIVVGGPTTNESLSPEFLQFGYIDTKGKLVIEKNRWIGLFDDMRYYQFYEGLAVTKCEGGWSYMDKKGNIVIKDVYSLAYPFNDGLAVVKKDGKYGAIDSSGKTIIEFKYELLYTFHGEMAKFYSEGKFGFINKKGEIVIDPKGNLTVFTSFDGGLALAKDETNGFKGYIDKSGDFVYIIDDEEIFDYCIVRKDFYKYDCHAQEYYLDYLEVK